MTSELSMIQAKAQICGKNGFTLIELLISLTILSVGILGVAQMQIAAIKGNSTALKLNQGIVIAQNQIESLMSTPFSSITSGSTTTTEGYNVDWTVTSVDLDDITTDADEGKSVQVVVKDSAGKKMAEMTFIADDEQLLNQ